jgi:hypothetical protein
METAGPAEFPRSNQPNWLSLGSTQRPPFFVFFMSAARTAERLYVGKRHASLGAPSRIPLLMLARERARSACGGCRPSPTARLQRKSTVCGLSGFLPSAKADGSLQLNPQPRSALLLLRLFAPCSNVNARFRFGKKNCASSSLFLSKTESKRFLERMERTSANGPTETVTAI